MADMIERARKLAALAQKATPGPWRVIGEHDPHGGAIAGDGGRFVLSIYESNNWPANRHLVAAAPEMAGLLSQMADRIEELEEDIRWLQERMGLKE